MFCAIWYHLYNQKPATLLKVTLLHGYYKWYEIVRNRATHHIFSPRLAI